MSQNENPAKNDDITNASEQQENLQGNNEEHLEYDSFSEEIEDLMLKGKLSPIQINGRYELGRNFSPLKWSGHLSFSTFKGEGVELSSAKLGSLWKPDEGLSLKAAFGRLRLESSEVQPWLYASLLSESRGPIEVSQIKAKALLKDREFSWSELTGVSGKEKLASSGTYGKGRVFQGSWAWQSRVRKLSWEFKASKESVTWLPQEDGMKEWLKSHKDYMETYDFIRLDPVPGGS